MVLIFPQTPAPDAAPQAAAGKRQERKALAVAGGAHALPDGFSDLIGIALPISENSFLDVLLGRLQDTADTSRARSVCRLVWHTAAG